MDRTLIGPYKAEEKELCERLYKKLEGLMLIYSPSEELKKCFSKDMFIKPNQLAFFHVFHYLLRIHDAAEFKKRFYWPITDKRGESAFRLSTVEYLKFLSEKHNLNWNVKTYLVQMPGGMKFIIFVLDVVAFVIGEQLRLREKQLGIEVTADGFSESNLKRMQKKHIFFKEYTAHYLNVVEQQTLRLRRTTQLIKAELNEIENEILIDIDNSLIKDFEKSNEGIFESKYEKHNQDIIVYENSLIALKTNIDMYQQKALELRKDKSNLRQVLQKINCSQSDVVKPTIENLTVAFVQIQPKIENWLSNVVDKNSAISEEMTAELKRLQLELEQIDEQITAYQHKLKVPNIPKNKITTDKESIINYNLNAKYVFTPPIKANPTENPIAHLPLLGDGNFRHRLELPSSVRKAKPVNSCLDLSTTLNRTQIIDPVQMLRTIYKDSIKKTKSTPTQSIKNLSLLGAKWKERQQLMFDVEPTENITPIRKNQLQNLNWERLNVSDQEDCQVDIKISSPMTPFNAHSDDKTRIALTSFMHHSPTIKKVDVLKEDAINIKNLSTSPTGRLEALCSADDFMETENNPNSQNVVKKPIFDIKSVINSNHDSIFDTSDTVLNDIL